MVSFDLEKAEVVAEISLKALAGTGYHSMIRDQHEIALILYEQVWSEYRFRSMHQTEYGPLAGITFDVPLNIEVSGFLAPMVHEMALNSISIVPQCSLIYDHVFVSVTDLPAATEILKNIRSRAEKGN